MHHNRICGRMFQILLTGVVTAMVAQASQAQELPPALRECRSEKADARRLACYDREVDAWKRSGKPGAETAAATPVTAPPASDDRFGYEDVQSRERRDRDRNESDVRDELVSVVTGISRRPDGAFLVTLENGQLWGEKSPDPDFRLRIGDRARIKRTPLGSYFLYGNSSRSARVTRLR